MNSKGNDRITDGKPETAGVSETTNGDTLDSHRKGLGEERPNRSKTAINGNRCKGGGFTVGPNPYTYRI